MRRHARKATSKGCVGPAFHILLHGMLHPAWVVLLPGLGLLILEPANLGGSVASAWYRITWVCHDCDESLADRRVQGVGRNGRNKGSGAGFS
eukprot:2109414-Rhodomonas_salina.2